jgi:PAS domain S-box-containing protein
MAIAAQKAAKPKADVSKTMLIDIPPDILKKMSAGSLPPPTPRHKMASNPPYAVMRDKVSTVSVQNADLQELFQGVYDAGFIASLKGDILDANVRATQFFYHTKKEFHEQTMGDIIIGFSETILNTISENLTNDKFTLIMAQCIRKDGTHFPAEISSSRLRLSSKDYLVFFVRDITARREAEDALIEAHTELEKEMAERTLINEELLIENNERKRAEAELNEAISKLREHDKAKSQFVSNVSHELKTPLTSISYIASNMLKGIAGPMPSRATEYLEMIRVDCRRLSRTVDDILDMSRIEANTLTLNLVKIPLNELVRRTMESLRIQAEAEDLKMTVMLPAEHVFVRCDPQKIERVIFNVVKNAIKFNVKDGSIEVALRKESRSPNYGELDIIDTGIGIEKKYHERIAERFFRIGEHVSGTGLGLAISKELLERHGGVLEFHSPPPHHQQGTQVTVRLPVAAPPTILIIYGDMNIRLRLTTQLAGYGYRVVNSEKSDAALAVLEQEDVSAIVLDWTGKEMESGIMIAKIRNDPRWKEVPLLAITGEEGAQKEGILDGFSIPRLKPEWEETDLTELLYDIVTRKKKKSE